MSDHDQYCFQCYRSETEFNCVNCPRSYHRECVKVSAFCDKVDVVNQENWLCPVCLFLKSTIHKYVYNWINLNVPFPNLVCYSFQSQRSEDDSRGTQIDHQSTLGTF